MLLIDQVYFLPRQAPHTPHQSVPVPAQSDHRSSWPFQHRAEPAAVLTVPLLSHNFARILFCPQPIDPLRLKAAPSHHQAHCQHYLFLPARFFLHH